MTLHEGFAILISWSNKLDLKKRFNRIPIESSQCFESNHFFAGCTCVVAFVATVSLISRINYANSPKSRIKSFSKILQTRFSIPFVILQRSSRANCKSEVVIRLTAVQNFSNNCSILRKPYPHGIPSAHEWNFHKPSGEIFETFERQKLMLFSFSTGNSVQRETEYSA